MQKVPIKITCISTERLHEKVLDNLTVKEEQCAITSQPLRRNLNETVKSGGMEFLVVGFQTMLQHDNYHNHAFAIDTASQTCFEIVLTTVSKNESENVAQTIADEIVKNL